MEEEFRGLEFQVFWVSEAQRSMVEYRRVRHSESYFIIELLVLLGDAGSFNIKQRLIYV